MKQIDFRTHADTARTEINDWVDHKTKGKITDLIQPGVLNPATQLVLVNAIYFKGQWAKEFAKHNTTECAFLRYFHPETAGAANEPDRRLQVC